MDKVGFHSARAAQIATLETRPDKTTPTMGTIHDVWEAKAVSIGFDPIALDSLLIPDRTHQFSDHQARRLFNHLAGPEGLTMNASTFDRRHIIQGIAAGLRQGAPVDLVERLADAFLTRVDIVELGAGREFTHASKYSTTELMALETTLTTSALARADEGCGIARPDAIEDAIARRPSMADEQVVMVEPLCRDGAGVAVVAASAGTGKTFALDAAHEAWRESGYTVIGAALAAMAARELESASNIPSATLTRLTSAASRPT